MASLLVICGLPPQSIILATPMGQGACPLLAACAPPPISIYSKYCFWNMTQRQKKPLLMEKETATLKHNFRLTFSRFFAKLPATSLVNKCDAIIRLIINGQGNAKR